jgi:hypothetical protein
VIPLAEAVILIPWPAYNAEREAAAAEIAELRDQLAVWNAWGAMALADATGHMHRCAKVNDVWACAPGCFWPELVTLRTSWPAARYSTLP